MAVCQLQRPHVRACVPVNAGRSAALHMPSMPACQRLSAFSSGHSAFCAKNRLTSRVGTSSVKLRSRQHRQQPAASFWFRSTQPPGSAAASAAAAHAAAILSVPLWQHAARSACVVVATLALAVTVSKFLIINSGKLEAGEVSITTVFGNLLELINLQASILVSADEVWYRSCSPGLHVAGGDLDGFCG